MKGNLRWDGRRVRCDTEKARKIGSFCEGEYVETLYRNKEGAFFLHQIGSKDLCKLGARGKLRPLTEEEAKEGCLMVIAPGEAMEWCEGHLPKAHYEFIFNGMPELTDREAWEKETYRWNDQKPLTERFAFSLATGLVQMVERAAEEDGVTKSKIVEEALILYFEKRKGDEAW